jgi:hypothetical protein
MSTIPHATTDDTPQFDSIIELGSDDPHYGPAEAWPSWTDDDRWEPGPEPAPYEDDTAEWPAYVPTDSDLAEWGEMCRRDEEHARWLRHLAEDV